LEKAELEELRLDKDRLLRQCDDLRQERSRLNSEVQELKNQNAQLIEDHTRDILSIKAKETQLVRARSDAEAAEAMCAQMRREMERLKRALTSAEKANGANSGIGSPTRDRDFSGGSDDTGIYRDTGLYSGQEGRRTPGIGNYGQRGAMSFTSQLSEEKENGVDGAAVARNKLRSPDLLGRGQDRSATTSGRGSPAREQYKKDGGGAPGSTESGQGVESWKRAAEVTSALKAKIEQMKVSFKTCQKPFTALTLVLLGSTGYFKAMTSRKSNSMITERIAFGRRIGCGFEISFWHWWEQLFLYLPHQLAREGGDDNYSY
jgi:cytoskeleton-associated protein 5